MQMRTIALLKRMQQDKPCRLLYAPPTFRTQLRHFNNQLHESFKNRAFKGPPEAPQYAIFHIQSDKTPKRNHPPPSHDMDPATQNYRLTGREYAVANQVQCISYRLTVTTNCIRGKVDLPKTPSLGVGG
jgi:hypothetical protein